MFDFLEKHKIGIPLVIFIINVISCILNVSIAIAETTFVNGGIAFFNAYIAYLMYTMWQDAKRTAIRNKNAKLEEVSHKIFDNS